MTCLTELSKIKAWVHSRSILSFCRFLPFVLLLLLIFYENLLDNLRTVIEINFFWPIWCFSIVFNMDKHESILLRETPCPRLAFLDSTRATSWYCKGMSFKSIVFPFEPPDNVRVSALIFQCVIARVFVPWLACILSWRRYKTPSPSFYQRSRITYNRTPDFSDTFLLRYPYSLYRPIPCSFLTISQRHLISASLSHWNPLLLNLFLKIFFKITPQYWLNYG